jgi:hypothetical protein
MALGLRWIGHRSSAHGRKVTVHTWIGRGGGATRLLHCTEDKVGRSYI